MIFYTFAPTIDAIMTCNFRITAILLVLIINIAAHSLSLKSLAYKGGEEIITLTSEDTKQVSVKAVSRIIDNNSTIGLCSCKMGDGELPISLDINTIIENSNTCYTLNKVKYFGNSGNVLRSISDNHYAFVDPKTIISSSFCILQRIINAYRILLF